MKKRVLSFVFLALFILSIIPAVNLFFDKVLVMTEDLKLQHNRLGLLQQIVSLADHVMDFTKLEGF